MALAAEGELSVENKSKFKKPGNIPNVNTMNYNYF
jgi:hypothetical protein